MKNAKHKFALSLHSINIYGHRKKNTTLQKPLVITFNVFGYISLCFLCSLEPLWPKTVPPSFTKKCFSSLF
jgi:hypothetical protein